MKKNEPIRMNTMKKKALIGEFSSVGPLSTAVASTACSMMSGHPSNEETMNKVIMASSTLSKFELYVFHFPRFSRH